MHQGRGNDAGGPGTGTPRGSDQFIEGLGDGPQRPGRRQGDLAKIVLRPHHALGHAGGAAGIEEEEVIWAAPDVQRRAIASFAQGLEAFGKATPGPHLDERLGVGKSWPNCLDVGPELLAENHRLRIGIVEDVENFFGRVAVVHIDVDEAGLETCRQQF